MINKIAIMGCGSLGTILGAYLNKAGLDVMMVDAYEEHVKALNEHGATVTQGVEMNVPVKACTPDQLEGTYDLFIYMAKQTYNETAIPQMVAHCGPETIICTCQNGLPELAVAKYYPAEKIMGATVGWPATFLRPGVSALTCDPSDAVFEFHLGRLKGEVDEKVYEVQAVLDKMCTGRVHITEHLMADRWSKVLINSTFSGMSTVTANTFRYALENEASAKCVVRIGREVVQVCKAMGITLPMIFGGDFMALYSYDDEAGMMNAVNIVRQFGGSDGKASMLQDLEKGRKCEIRFINGVVSEAGKEYGVPTPYCDAVVDIVSKVENGELPLRDNTKYMPDLPI
ncbi:MAG: ketopantoate reductase family protein [Lachnospiraceae bacterium]|nr:ketopantoate reductase family protein [Lachnospiraceae bacterium]